MYPRYLITYYEYQVLFKSDNLNL
eukprot:SAG31_NODE_1664_length_7585_cov_10.994523_12_plen_23_part_01